MKQKIFKWKSNCDYFIVKCFTFTTIIIIVHLYLKIVHQKFDLIENDMIWVLHTFFLLFSHVLHKFFSILPSNYNPSIFFYMSYTFFSRNSFDTHTNFIFCSKILFFLLFLEKLLCVCVFIIFFRGNGDSVNKRNPFIIISILAIMVIKVCENLVLKTAGPMQITAWF